MIHATIVSRRQAVLGAGLCLIPGVAVPVWAKDAPAATKRTIEGPDGRAIEIWRWAPVGKSRGTIAFSHGAASAPLKYDRLLGPWAQAGYEVLAPLHVDSTDHPRTKEFIGLASWKARIEDMRALSATIRASRFIAAGHSYGGLTALTMGGAEAVMPAGLTGVQRDPRVAAVVALSPPGPVPTLIPESGYAKLAVPALIQTGDRDVPLGSPPGTDWHVHLAPFDAASAGGNRYALVLDGVDHYFGGLICRVQDGPPQTAQLARTTELSTLFMNGFLGGDKSARRALDARRSDTGPVRLALK